jgi:hypothetical protein
MTTAKKEEPAASVEPNPQRLTCGIVMPISEIDGLVERHWADVHAILLDAISDAGFNGRLVSAGADVGVIHRRIVQNLFDDAIVVVDVSARNPNVMFELGMRLTFDKPTVIVKDDPTPYSFDTSVIEHVGYPRDLRFPQMVDFKQRLTKKIQDTHEAAKKDNGFSPFLKHFGTFTTPKLDKKEVGVEHFLLERLEQLSDAVARLSDSPGKGWGGPGLYINRAPRGNARISVPALSRAKWHVIRDALMSTVGVTGASLDHVGTPEAHIFLELTADMSDQEMSETVSRIHTMASAP